MTAHTNVHPIFTMCADLSGRLSAIRPLLSPEETEVLSTLLVTRDAEALTTFIQDVQKSRIRALAMHTEISTLRFRDGDVSEDVSSVFRETLNQPLDTDSPQVITDAGFGEKGGSMGRVSGRVAFVEFWDVPIYDHAADEDTVVLPEGYEIRLRAGERIIIRNAGYRIGGGEMGLALFSHGNPSLAIRAEEDGVVITGPATIARCEDVSAAEALFPEREKSFGSRKSWISLLPWNRSASAGHVLGFGDEIQFFPSRKIVTRGDAGVRVIKPQSRLSQG